jgi:hypothetical protein
MTLSQATSRHSCVVRRAVTGHSDRILGLVEDANLFRPLAANKKASSREMSSNGVFTTGDLRTAAAKRGKDEVEAFLQAARMPELREPASNPATLRSSSASGQ